MHSNHNGQHIPGNTFIPQLNATAARKFTLVQYKQKHVSTHSPTLQMEHWNVVVMVLLDWAHTTQLSMKVQLPIDQRLKFWRGVT